MSVLLPSDPDIIVLGYNPAYFFFAFCAALAILFIWESRTGGGQ